MYASGESVGTARAVDVEFLVRAVVAGVKHYLPQLALVAILIPWLLVVSLVAGWLVKSSVPVGVELK